MGEGGGIVLFLPVSRRREYGMNPIISFTLELYADKVTKVANASGHTGKYKGGNDAAQKIVAV